MTTKRPRILVTGATGFIGRVFCDLLREQQVPFRAVMREKAVPATASFPVRTIDGMTDWEGAFDGIECVVHLAARTPHRTEPTKDLDAEYRKVNIEGTRRLAQEAARAGLKRFVYLSTIKVNGERTVKQALTEETPAAPEDAYAASKWEGEEAVRAVSQKTGMEHVILRSPLVYGPGVTANFQNLMRWVLHAKVLPLGTIRNRLSMTYVGNLADALLAATGLPNLANRTFVVSDEKPLSTTHLVRRLREALGTKPMLLPIPRLALRPLAHLPTVGKPIRRLTDSLEVDGALFRQEAHWTPPFSSEEGLESTAKWYLDMRRKGIL